MNNKDQVALISYLSGIKASESMHVAATEYQHVKEMVREHLTFLKKIESKAHVERKSFHKDNNSLGLEALTLEYVEAESFQELLRANQLHFVEKLGDFYQVTGTKKERKKKLKDFQELYANAVEVDHMIEEKEGYRVEYKKLGSFFPSYTHTVSFNTQGEPVHYQLYHPQWKRVEEDKHIQQYIDEGEYRSVEVEIVGQLFKQVIVEKRKGSFL